MVTQQPTTEILGAEDGPITRRDLGRLKIVGGILTVLGLILFSYFLWSVGISELWLNIRRFGIAGFAAIVLIYAFRILARAGAWKLSVYEPYRLTMRDTVSGVIIGEALSTMIPLGIVISGTSKALSVKRHVPLVVGLSSVATENLFYSFTTSLFLMGGALTLIGGFVLDDFWKAAIGVVVAGLAGLLVLGVVMIVRQWHFASEACEWLYDRGYFRRYLEPVRLKVRLFENLIYGFYRKHPRRFLPICLLEAAFHALGVAEVYLILTRIMPEPTVVTAFLLESVSRMITIIFKLVPFMIGVDEAGSQLIANTIAAGAGIGVTLALIRKSRILFWTVIGMLVLANRGLSIRELRRHV